MSTQINDGGPAFPTTDPNYEQKYSGAGLSLRDYFAAKALLGILSAGREPQYGGSSMGGDAHAAYALADAMLAERDAA